MSEQPVLVWFRQDLRLADNPALAEAVKTGKPVLALYILDDATPGKWAMGGASRWWLHGSLKELSENLKRHGVQLILRRGRAADVLDAIITASGADTVYWNRQYEPYAIARDKDLKASLKSRNISAESFGASLLFEPWELKSQSGTPFKVFTPFYKTALKLPPPRKPLPAPKSIVASDKTLPGNNLRDWGLLHV